MEENIVFQLEYCFSNNRTWYPVFRTYSEENAEQLVEILSQEDLQSVYRSRPVPDIGRFVKVDDKHYDCYGA